MKELHISELNGSKRVRQSNIELLRIVAMLLILTLHTRYDGITSVYDGIIDASHICSFSIEALSIVGVNLFVLISGYFGIHLKKRSVLNLIFQVYFFAIVGLIGWMAMQGTLNVETKYYIKALLPFSHTIWFLPSYVMLMLFSPFLNAFIEKSDLKQMVIMTGVLYSLSYIWGTLIEGTIGGFGGYNWGWFIILYLTGNIIKRITEKKHVKTTYCMLGYLICTLIMVLIAIVQDYYPIGKCVLWNYNFPLIFISSICLFICFVNLRIQYNRIINWLAASSFAVLLFHVSPISKYSELCKQIYEANSGIVCIAYTTILIILTYLAATIIDQIRIFLFKKIYRE